MRSVFKFIIYALMIIFVPSIVMLILTNFSMENFMLLFLGQAIVILLLVSFYFLSRKIIKKYEKQTIKMIEEEKDIDKLKQLRQKRISYKSKANITKRIIDLEFSKEECKMLRKYSSYYEDNVFYYAKLIQNDKDNRDIYKEKRDKFNKRYKNKKFVFIDFKENLKTSLKWMIVFFIFSFISSLNPFRLVGNIDIYIMLVLLNFAFNLSLVINTIIWIIRSLRSYWIRAYI